MRIREVPFYENPHDSSPLLAQLPYRLFAREQGLRAHRILKITSPIRLKGNDIIPCEIYKSGTRAMMSLWCHLVTSYWPYETVLAHARFFSTQVTFKPTKLSFVVASWGISWKIIKWMGIKGLRDLMESLQLKHLDTYFVYYRIYPLDITAV